MNQKLCSKKNHQLPPAKKETEEEKEMMEMEGPSYANVVKPI